MALRADLRASDADREQTGERLRQATSEGRLAAHELEQRLAAALRARTYGELDMLVADLPGDRVGRTERHRSTGVALARPALALALLVPVVMVVIFLVTSVTALWVVWAVLGWWFFGRFGCCRRAHCGPRAHRRHDYRFERGRGGAGPRGWV